MRRKKRSKEPEDVTRFVVYTPREIASVEDKIDRLLATEDEAIVEVRIGSRGKWRLGARVSVARGRINKGARVA